MTKGTGACRDCRGRDTDESWMMDDKWRVTWVPVSAKKDAVYIRHDNCLPPSPMLVNVDASPLGLRRPGEKRCRPSEHVSGHKHLNIDI